MKGHKDEDSSTEAAISRRGRPRKGEQQQRRQRVIDAAFVELVERGYDGVTMLGIANRAGASKETLYSWFGSRAGLFTVLIEDTADRAAERIQAALVGAAAPTETLTSFATGLLTLLTSEQSVALNRAAMTSPELAEVLLASGRHRAGPLVEKYLARLSDDGFLQVTDSSAAFRLLYGLIIQDTQMRVLLGEAPPSSAAIAREAATAVDRFLRLAGSH